MRFWIDTVFLRLLAFFWTLSWEKEFWVTREPLGLPLVLGHACPEEG